MPKSRKMPDSSGHVDRGSGSLSGQVNTLINVVNIMNVIEMINIMNITGGKCMKDTALRGDCA